MRVLISGMEKVVAGKDATIVLVYCVVFRWGLPVTAVNPLSPVMRVRAVRPRDGTTVRGVAVKATTTILDVGVQVLSVKANF